MPSHCKDQVTCCALHCTAPRDSRRLRCWPEFLGPPADSQLAAPIAILPVRRPAEAHLDVGDVVVAGYDDIAAARLGHVPRQRVDQRQLCRPVALPVVSCRCADYRSASRESVLLSTRGHVERWAQEATLPQVIRHAHGRQPVSSRQGWSVDLSRSHRALLQTTLSNVCTIKLMRTLTAITSLCSR